MLQIWASERPCLQYRFASDDRGGPIREWSFEVNCCLLKNAGSRVNQTEKHHTFYFFVGGADNICLTNVLTSLFCELREKSSLSHEFPHKTSCIARKEANFPELQAWKWDQFWLQSAVERKDVMGIKWKQLWVGLKRTDKSKLRHVLNRMSGNEIVQLSKIRC